MSNSSLICYTKISPHRNSPRNNSIKKITIHHMAGNLSVETCGNVFQNRQASANYGIGSDGRIAMYVEEKDRSWASSSGTNDHQAVTIEVANDSGAPNWHVSDKAMESLINLCVDICKRNGIAKLNFTGNSSGNLTMHKYFAATACPGPYLESKFPYIAQEVNKRLNAKNTTAIDSLAKKGVIDTAAYWVATQDTLNNLPILLEKLAGAVGDKDVASVKTAEEAIKRLVTYKVINSPDYWLANYDKVKYLDSLLIKAANRIGGVSSYKVKVTTDALNIRSGAGTNYAIVGVIRDEGVYTIVDEKNGWGLLKSGAGWISLEYTKKV